MNRVFLITKPNSNRTSCFICHSIITTQEIRISLKKYDHYRYYHLNCFDPPEYHYIKPKDLDINLKENQDLETVEAWRISWNRNFFPLDPEIPISVQTNKVIITKPSKFSQIFGLIFRFLTIDELVNDAELTCKSFYCAAWDDSLWGFLLYRDFGIEIESKELRKKYAQESFERCVKCKKKDKLKRCELLERNICSSCKGYFNREYFSRSKIMEIYGVDPFKAGFRSKSFDGSTKYYSEIYLIKKLPRFRRENKIKAIQMLVELLGPDSEFIQIIKNINIECMEKKIKVKIGLYRNKEITVSSYNQIYEQITSYKLIFDYIRSGKFKKLSNFKALSLIKSEVNSDLIF